MVPTTAALAEPEPLIMPIALDPTTAVCGINCRERAGETPHDVDHRALRVEAVGARPASSRKAAIRVSASWP